MTAKAIILASTGPAAFMWLLLVLLVVVVPIAAVAFSRSGKGLEQLGKGTFAIDREEPAKRGAPLPPTDPLMREAEVRQMVEAAGFRRQQRGEAAIDTDAEIRRLLSGGEVGADPGSEEPAGQAHEDPETRQIREEIRQLVISNNERRIRRGDEALDVESEVDRRLREWT